MLVDGAGELNQRELARQLRIDPGNLVAILDSLEVDGLIARPRGEEDRRQRLVGLTAKGKQLLAKALRGTAAIDERSSRRYPPRSGSGIAR